MEYLSWSGAQHKKIKLYILWQDSEKENTTVSIVHIKYVLEPVHTF